MGMRLHRLPARFSQDLRGVPVTAKRDVGVLHASSMQRRQAMQSWPLSTAWMLQSSLANLCLDALVYSDVRSNRANDALHMRFV